MFNASEFATNNRGKLVKLTRHEGVVIGYNPKENLVLVFVGDASTLKWSDSVISKHNCYWFDCYWFVADEFKNWDEVYCGREVELINKPATKQEIHYLMTLLELL